MSKPCPALKSLSNKVGGMLCCRNSPNKYKRLDTKLERKMMEVKKSASGNNIFKSFNSIILRFPQFKEGLKDIRGMFERYDEDSNGTIDREELKKCLQKLQLCPTEKEIDDLFHSCDIDGSEGIQFNEFIVLLCLIYLLIDPSTSPHMTSKVGSPQLEATFDTIIEAFLFLDKNGDGKLNKKDVVKALNDASPWEKSPSHVTRTRFKEMDCDRNGNVSFREFLFALIDWVGIDTDDEVPATES
ncbi:probable calcium-binding protein CML22 isoform X2 [Cornus florida]|nr:probable calcium-binding protein CML22 isoform X2 [Cornus florida]XP_059651718.1 probable calcium-binding protein CML22 isoform X2 [Cornus florida]